MTREWKPGDVAAAKHPLSDGDVRGIIDTDGRFYTTDLTCRGISSSAFALSNLRPLVVVDPEDREQVERLAAAIVTPEGRIEPSMERFVDRIADALRSLLAPPKPDEPTGLGAVVEDADGTLWTRFSRPVGCDDGAHWAHETATQGNRAYADITAVRVLSEGVTE